MFGYVKADKPQLRVREYEYYRSVYCGLCRALGKCGGQCARMTLSYDFAFMALVRMAIEGSSPSFKGRRCFVHPLKKRPMAEINGTLEFCAAASVLLSYHKLRDNISDERGIKRFRARAASPFLAVMKRKSSKKYKALENKMLKSLSELAELEKSELEPSIDRPAELFGELLADIMAEGLEGSGERIARKIGRHVGKWIYIIDAIDDYDEDLKRSRYNPLVGVCGKDGISDETCEALKNALKNELVEAEKAFDLIDYPDRDIREIICNIIYLGMPKAAKEIINKLDRKEASVNDRSL